MKWQIFVQLQFWLPINLNIKLYGVFFPLNFQTNFKVINTQPSSQVETNQISVITVYRNLLQHWLRTLVYKHGFLCVNAFFID